MHLLVNNVSVATVTVENPEHHELHEIFFKLSANCKTELLTWIGMSLT